MKGVGLSRSKKHHFVPQFLIQKWADADGRVPCWQRCDLRLKFHRMLPREVAHERYLYSREAGPVEKRDSIESGFFDRVIDGPAAQAINQLIAGTPALSAEQWQAIVLFFIASRLRTPNIVSHIKEKGKLLLESELSVHDTDFENLKGESPAQNLLEWSRMNVPDQLPNWPIELLPRMVLDKDLANRMFRMKWLKIQLQRYSGVEVLLSDRPLMMAYGIDHPRHVQALPLSPLHLLVASPSEAVMHEMLKRRPSDVVRAVNRSLVAQADRFAFGRAPPRFFERHLARLERP